MLIHVALTAGMVCHQWADTCYGKGKKVLMQRMGLLLMC
jgi:hypothetical protein